MCESLSNSNFSIPIHIFVFSSFSIFNFISFINFCIHFVYSVCVNFQWIESAFERFEWMTSDWSDWTARQYYNVDLSQLAARSSQPSTRLSSFPAFVTKHKTHRKLPNFLRHYYIYVSIAKSQNLLSFLFLSISIYWTHDVIIFWAHHYWKVSLTDCRRLTTRSTFIMIMITIILVCN